MPFITEEVYGYLPNAEGMLINAPWPVCRPEFDFTDEAVRMDGVMDAEMDVPARRLRLVLEGVDADDIIDQADALGVFL